MQVSVAIIARDSEKFLPKCLESIRDLTDDIVVVIDKRTTDSTAQIAGEYKAGIFYRDFDNFASQKNYAVSQTKYNWVLSLDADETASEGLVKAIKNLPAIPLFSHYSIPRQNLIFSKLIKYTNWDPYGLIRLFDKRQSKWVGDVHEEIVASGQSGRLFDPIYHDNYRSVEEFMTRQDIYSSRQADQFYKQGTKFSIFQFFWQPKLDFFRRFFVHTGFLDGWHGLFLCYLMVTYHLSVWIKLWQKYQKVSS